MFITVYPEHEPQFLELLDELKDITDSYDLDPYILNEQQWRESNVFFRYGGLKRINMIVGGKERLAIRTPEEELIEDEQGLTIIFRTSSRSMNTSGRTIRFHQRRTSES